MTVGKMFGKATMTRTLVGEEPMVTLDAVALTARIGPVSHTEKPRESVYLAITSRPVPTEPKWRSYLRAREVAS